ncbi:hypothetical protein V5O48_000472 [Marasmius crinis-equi]|uniref:Fido domain-containing protein n=1 Tax=Marasmius crinis-equi TaxID=585013 RepID=A0ABR3G177_9AGAR
MSQLPFNSCQYFLNKDRPLIESHPLLAYNQDSPVDQALLPSLQPSRRGTLGLEEHVSAARLWESLYESTSNLQVQGRAMITLLVADMRCFLGSRGTALPLYLELSQVLQDEKFTRWVKKSLERYNKEVGRELHGYKTSTTFTPSQRFKPEVANDSFPYCRVPQAKLRELRGLWASTGDPQAVLDQFCNFHCLESNALEGKVSFNYSSTTMLVQFGFFAQVQGLTGEPEGDVQDRASAIEILKDTRQALDVVFQLLRRNTVQGKISLNVSTILELHRLMMASSRLLRASKRGEQRISYTNIGMTRQTTETNVTVATGPVKVQFCPFDSVDEELGRFCGKFNELVNAADMDPFAAAAWISHVFLAIHPFEVCPLGMVVIICLRSLSTCRTGTEGSRES